MATRVIVFGAEGLLGGSIVAQADAYMAASGLDREACDITDLERIREICSILRPKALVNCAAYTDVDGAESNPELAMAVNGIGAGNVAKIAEAHGVPVVHISTDYVFDGKARKPYREAAKPNPQSVYGKSKLMGEEEVRKHASRHLIIRTGWLYGAGAENFVTRILEQARSGQPLQVVDDQVGCPTSATDLAGIVLELLQRRKTGIVHAVNTGQATWHDLACKALELAGVQAAVQRISSAQLGRPAPRPSYCALDTNKLESWLDEPMPTWEDALGRFLLEEAMSRS